MLGALDAITLELETVVNQTTIRTGSVCQLIRQLRKKHPEQPITLVVDNASYFHSKITRLFAIIFDIELLYLPAYSPNLNLIERLWKFVKKKCLYSTYYETFDEFVAGIETCLEETQSVHKDEMKSLLTLKFQSLKKLKML